MRRLFSAAEVAAATGGRVVAGDPAAFFSDVQVDSRVVEAGGLFFALPGERTDGHRFVPQALARGAGAVVREAPDAVPPAAVLIRVADPAQALLDLAAFHRRRFAVRVVGITGSVGKTGTKEFTAAVLAVRHPTLKSEGNYNTGIGLPLTVFRLEERHRVAVLEMGMRGRGEIAALARAARPEVGVITVIGEAHLERLGSVEAIARAKGELLEALPRDGLAVLNADDPRSRALAAGCPCPVVFFGLREGEVTAQDVQPRGAAGTDFILRVGGEETAAHLGLPGRHQVLNALAAAAVARRFGLTLEETARGLAAATLAPGRGRPEVLGGIILVDDTYNASPTSMEAALHALSELDVSRRLAVLGPMRELGSYSAAGHRRVGEAAAQAGVDLLLLAGAEAAAIGEGARGAGLPADRIVALADREAAGDFLLERLRPGDGVLVKASRSEGLERVAQRVRERFGGVGR